jgi:HNH endonuclease
MIEYKHRRETLLQSLPAQISCWREPMPNQSTPVRQIIFPIGPSIAYVPLTQGLFSLIDSWNARKISDRNWYATRDVRGAFYARGSAGQAKKTPLARVILPTSSDMCVDHRNGNTLDNREANLRTATVAQNQMNRAAHRINPTGFKWVHETPTGFISQIQANGVTYPCGRFNTALEAHMAAREKSIELHGEFARAKWGES